MNKIIGDFDEDADGSISMAEWLERTEKKFDEVVSHIMVQKLNEESIKTVNKEIANTFDEVAFAV